MKTIALWLLIVFVLSVIPVESGPKTPYADKLLHFLLYAITCALFFSVFIRGRTFKRAIVLSVLLSAGYGLLMETIQHFLYARSALGAPTRSFSVLDIAVNALGSLATAGYLAVKRRRK